MDILSRVAVRLPCRWCGESYFVPLRDVLLSHQVMHEGCPVPEETECPPVFQSRLAAESAVKAFEEAWGRLERRALADGGELALMNPSSPENESKRSGEQAASDRRADGSRV